MLDFYSLFFCKIQIKCHVLYNVKQLYCNMRTYEEAGVFSPPCFYFDAVFIYLSQLTRGGGGGHRGGISAVVGARFQL